MSNKIHPLEFVLDAESANKQGMLSVILTEQPRHTIETTFRDQAMSEGRTLRYIDGCAQSILLPNPFDEISHDDIATWLTHALCNIKVMDSIRAIVRSAIVFAINGLLLKNCIISFQGLADIMRSRHETFDLARELDREHHDQASLTLDQRKACYQVLAFEARNNDFAPMAFRFAFPRLSFLNSRWPTDNRRSSTKILSEPLAGTVTTPLSWEQIIKARSLTVIEFNNAQSVHESNILIPAIGSRLAMQSGLTAIYPDNGT